MFYLLPLLLLLSGCSMKPADRVNPAQTLWIPEQSEASTDADSRYYRVHDKKVLALYPVGKGIAAVYEEENNVCIVLCTGENLTSSAAVQLEEVSFSDISLRKSHEGLLIADRESAQLLLLDDNLRETARMALPGDYDSGGCIASGRFYYSTGTAIRVLDGGDGTNRLIKKMPCEDAGISIAPEGNIAVCIMRDGEPETQILAPHNGTCLERIAGHLRLSGSGAVHTGEYSDPGGELLVSWKEAQNPTAFLLPAGCRLLTFSPDGVYALTFEKATGTVNLYNAWEGMLLCSRSVPGQVVSAALDNWGEISILLSGEEGARLLRWKPILKAAKAQDLPGAPFCRMDGEVKSAMEQCREIARKLSRDAGVPITIKPSGQWDLKPEYQPVRLKAALDNLSQCLQYFPEDFFALLPLDGLTIELVSAGAADPPDAGGYSCRGEGRMVVGIVAGTGQEGWALFHSLSHLLDTKVLTACSAYDNWDQLNPGEFRYGIPGNEEAPEFRACFPSERAMASPAEDRAELFALSVQPGQGTLFQNAAMQRKLLRLCTGLRNVLDMQDCPTIFRWEQYLYEILAPAGQARNG